MKIGNGYTDPLRLREILVISQCFYLTFVSLIRITRIN